MFSEGMTMENLKPKGAFQHYIEACAELESERVAYQKLIDSVEKALKFIEDREAHPQRAPGKTRLLTLVAA